MTKATTIVGGSLGVIVGAAIAGLGTGVGMAYGSHLFQTGQLPLPGAPGGPVGRARRGRRKAVCKVAVKDRMIDHWEGGPPEGQYRIVATCEGRRVGEILVEVSTAPMTRNCQKNARQQRAQHKLRYRTAAARTVWTGLDREHQRTGLGTKMYRAAQREAYKLGVPLVPDACITGVYDAGMMQVGETSDDAWRVWQRKLAWEGRTARKRRLR